MKEKISYWQYNAQLTYENLKMKLLPESLRRNNLQYYYLGVYPPLSKMNYLNHPNLPTYPSKINSLYVHVPFCVSICNFCNYFKTIINPKKSRETIKWYFDLLKKELLYHASFTRLDISYIYFGGGTPSLVPPDILVDFFEFMKKNNFLQNQLIGSMEIHPNLFKSKEESKKLLKVLRDYGINRVSVGYQFDSNRLQKTYQREQQLEFFESAVKLIKDHKMFLNVDLMYGLPEQSFNDWEVSLKNANRQNPDSITAYFAFAGKHTVFCNKIESGKFQVLSHKEIQTQQIMTQMYLEKNGFQELPSNFFAQVNGQPHEVKPLQLPSESISLAIGPGTYSFFNNTQFINVFDLKLYEEKINSNQSPIWRGYHFNNSEMIHRDLMFSCKNALSIDIEQLKDKYKINPLNIEKFSSIFELLFQYQLIIQSNDIIKLTPKGRLIADEIGFLFKIPGIKQNYKKEDKIILEKYNFAMTYPEL